MHVSLFDIIAGNACKLASLHACMCVCVFLSLRVTADQGMRQGKCLNVA
jgi:hypothetical protein